MISLWWFQATVKLNLKRWSLLVIPILLKGDSWNPFPHDFQYALSVWPQTWHDSYLVYAISVSMVLYLLDRCYGYKNQQNDVIWWNCLFFENFMGFNVPAPTCFKKQNIRTNEYFYWHTLFNWINILIKKTLSSIYFNVEQYIQTLYVLSNVVTLSCLS